MSLIRFFLKTITIISFFSLNTGSTSCNEPKEKKEPLTVDNDSIALYKKYNLDKIKLPAGFKIGVYAEVPYARSLTLSPSGIVYVGNRDGNKVFAVVDDNKDGKVIKYIR